MPPRLPTRLRDSYHCLVKGFGKAASLFAPGPGATVVHRRAASFAQKLWRFCQNKRVTFPALIEPLIQRVRDEAPRAGVLLAVHDWSTLGFASHESKADRATLTHEHDVGYDLATVLVVRGADGACLAPVSLRLTTKKKAVLTTETGPVAKIAHVDQIRPRMDRIAAMNRGADVVHVIDREADAVGHWRDWAAAGHRALVRADDRLVTHDGRERKQADIADDMRAAGGLADSGEALWHGRRARRFTGEAVVVLERPARRRQGKTQVDVPGEPLTLRLVVVELRDPQGRLLARWLLLTNVSAEAADAATVAAW